MEYFTAYVEVAHKMANARLDETEQCVLPLFLLAHSARQLLPQQSKGIAPLMDDVFRCLKQHYESHYEDVAVRMDTVIQLAHELLNIRRLIDEHMVFLQLCGKKTFVAELKNKP
ncbi:hypothetical protein AAVH_41003 [Aphelenchoides avenae]|nr:hypothetical protein AAVH_41003 [Aphelenchus avenae]